MQYRTFDRLTRTVAAQSTRRGFLGTMGALVAAGFAGTALGQRRDFEKKLANAADDPEEQMVLLFEELGRIAHEHDGTCGELAEKARKFDASYRDQIEKMRAVEATWTKDHRKQHADTYGDRREAVVTHLVVAREQCQPDDSNAATPRAASPVAASPVAVMPSSGLAGRVPTGMEAAALDDFYSQNAGCTADNSNFMAEAYCFRVASDWKSPSFQWQAYCTGESIDDNCELCGTDPTGTSSAGDFCTHYWPQDCVDGQGHNLCGVDYHHTHTGIASAICDKADSSKIFSDTVYCYSNESSWRSRKFTWNLYCPAGRIGKSCIDCQTDSAYEGLAGQAICAKYWPQDCIKDGTRNVCHIGPYVSCCDKNCPVGTSDCTLSGLESFGDEGQACAGCQLSWCGSTSKCQEYCTQEGCCDEACSEQASSGPPGGLVRTGTPVPLGTPVNPPPGTPATEVPPPLPPGTPATEVPPPLPPGTPATEVPPPLPPGTPATEVPTETPGTPSASPSV